MSDQPVSPPPPSEGSNKKVLKVVGLSCLGILILGVLGIGGCVYAGLQGFKQNDPYKHAIEFVTTNESAKAALGEPIKAGFMPSGSISVNNGVGEADWNISVSGPKGKGVIKVIGTKSAGVWTYSVMELTVTGTGEKIPLMQP